MFIVVFHYIVDCGCPGFALRGPDKTEFLSLLDKLEKQFEIVDLDTLCRKRKEREGNYCSITFDDGLVDHFNVAPELLSRNIPAVFFPVASVFDGYVPTVIKMHIILSKIKIEEMVEKFEEFLLKQGLTQFVPIPREKKLSELRPLDDILTANLKYIMQNLSEEIKKVFVDEQFNRFVSDEKKFCREFFMTPEQLREIYERGIEIGCHTYSHTSLKTMSYEEQKKDLAKSKKIIEDIIGAEINSISYPFGGFNQDTPIVAKELGFKRGVVFEHRVISATDDDLLMPNLDCRDQLPLTTFTKID